MRIYFCKALDRPVNIFGLKGAWITSFLVAAGGCVFLALVAGFSTTAGIGICIAIIGCIMAFVVCYMMQQKVSHHDLKKKSLVGRSRGYVKRRETLCRIVYTSVEEPSWFHEAQRRRDMEQLELENHDR